MDLLDLTAEAEADHFWFYGFRSFVAPVLAELAAGRGNLQLIDCGCGTGHNLSLLSQHGRAFGFDLTPGVGETRRDSPPFVQANILHIPFATDSFDIATSFDVLQCVSADVEAVREIARVVRPGGAIVLTLAALEMLGGDHAEVWREVHRYTPSTARRLVAQAGLHAERVSFLFASIFPLMLAVRLSQRASRPFRHLREDADIRVPFAPINAVLRSLVRAEAALARQVPMPVGSSLLVVARKSSAT